MGTKKRKGARNAAISQDDTLDKKSLLHTSVGSRPDKSRNGLTAKVKHSEVTQKSKSTRSVQWVTVLLVSFVVGSVAVFYACPDVHTAVTDLIVRYTQLEESILPTAHPSNSKEDPHSVASSPATTDESDAVESPAKTDESDSVAGSPARSDGSGDATHKTTPPSSNGAKSEEVLGTKDHPGKDSGNQDHEEKQERGSDKATKSPMSGYVLANITNTLDYRIRKELDKADTLLDKNQIDDALTEFEHLVQVHPASPRALYGQATALDKVAEKRQSNKFLEMCIDAFEKLLKLADVPDALFKTAGRRLADRQQFRGFGPRATRTLQTLTRKFPSDISLQNELGVSYLMIGQDTNAKTVFQNILSTNPEDGFALVHMGFILKTSEKNPADAVEYLERGINTRDEGTSDSRFYYHLGDALQRIGETNKAYKYYKEAASFGLFLSAYQRSIYNVDYLKSKPFWSIRDTGLEAELKSLSQRWQEIRNEGLAQLDSNTGLFKGEEENLREKGDWKQLTLYQQGRKHVRNCEKTPVTCSIVDRIPDAVGCKRGQVKFSVMEPGVHVWPHCGPTNCRIRAHLGLVVPPGPRIRVANETREWREGQFIIFDDSFEHEVWHDGDTRRLVLIVDFWHPQLTDDLKRTLSPI